MNVDFSFSFERQVCVRKNINSTKNYVPYVPMWFDFI